jgi:hypothetical protein
MKEAAIAGVIPAVISAIAVYFSAKSEKNSRPVSNGFASHVLKTLDRIEENLEKHINADDPHSTRR